jgi:hypothetical protein
VTHISARLSAGGVAASGVTAASLHRARNGQTSYLPRASLRASSLASSQPQRLTVVNTE